MSLFSFTGRGSGLSPSKSCVKSHRRNRQRPKPCPFARRCSTRRSTWCARATSSSACATLRARALSMSIASAFWSATKPTMRSICAASRSAITIPSCCGERAKPTSARIQRIDHLNCFTPDVQASYDFYSELGFRLTEYSETDGADPKLWAVWLQRKGNVHDLAFTNGLGPRLHHVGVWTASVLDIIHICDVMATSGYLANMERGPGRHGISNAFFLYVRDPDGHRVELFTSDYLTADPDHEPLRWSLRDPQRQTLWGHPAPRSWFEEGSVFSDITPRAPVLAAQPIVAH